MTTILVTGASSGIGAAVAAKLAEQAVVYGAARRTTQIPPGVRPLQLDLADPQQIDAAMDHLLAEVDRVDVLVNCAGFGEFAPIELTGPQSMRDQMQVNVIGAAHVTQRLLPGMRAARRGRIVMVSSVASAFSSPMGGWYHASKAALEAMSAALRVEVGPFGIHVAVVQPGPVRTDWHERALGDLTGATRGTAYDAMAEAVSAYHAKAADSPMMSEVETVADAVIRAVLDERPRTHYPVGRGAKMAMTMGRLLPARTFDALTRKQFGIDQQVCERMLA